MQNKYCLPIIKSTQAEVLATAAAAQTNYGFFEVWLDYIEDYKTGFITDLTSKYPGRVVLVFRRQNLEPINMPTEKRLEILDTLPGKDCLVDMDITCQKEDLEHIKSKGLKTIVSYHNYDKTPADNELGEIISTIKTYRPFIAKISTLCTEPSDALRLIGIKKDFLENGEKHVVLGMGAHGEITRVFGALWGSELIFIPETNAESSAPGQISRTEFDKIIERINK